MKRTAGGLVLLAMMGGCMANHDDPEMMNLISQRSRQLAMAEPAPAAPQPRRPVAVQPASPAVVAQPASPAVVAPPASPPLVAQAANPPVAAPPASPPQEDDQAAVRPSGPPARSAPAVPVAALASTTPTVLPEQPHAAPAAPAAEPPDSDLALASATAAEPSPAAAGQDSQNIIAINTKRLMLDYEVKDAGPPGQAAVELWYTRNGQNWKRYGEAQNQPPFIVELEDEGLYGFTLRAHNVAGQGKPPPSPGEPPQALVEVDLTRPVVRLADLLADAQGKTMTILWDAADKNLAPHPITLSWARQANGPWSPIGSSLDNSGRYVWKLPADVPPRFLVRVEAVDTAGNVGTAETPEAVGLTASQPAPQDQPPQNVAVQAGQPAPPPAPVEPDESYTAPHVQLRLEPAGS